MAAAAYITEPGMHPELDNADYHADPVVGGSLSSSGARRIIPPGGCPALFKYDRDVGRAPKAVFDFGHAAHASVLGDGETIVVVKADAWRSNEAKAKRAEAYEAGKVPILTKDAETVAAMAEAIKSSPAAMALLTGGRSEQSIVWRDDRSGVMCRAKFDHVPRRHNGRQVALSDYKTTTDVDPEAIGKTIADHGLHQQADWYLSGARALGLADHDTRFVFIFQAKTAPYLVSVVELDETTLRIGAGRNRWALDTYKQCTTTDEWPPYVQGITQVALPHWAVMKAEREGLI